MKISLPKINQPYEVQNDIWIDGDFEPTAPARKYLEASGRLEEYDPESAIGYARRSHKGSDVHYFDPSQKLLLYAGDVIEFYNFYPGARLLFTSGEDDVDAWRGGFEFKFLSSKSPTLLHSKTLFKGAVDDELELKEVSVKKKNKGPLKNFISPKILAFTTVAGGTGRPSDGIWAKYVDAVDPSQSFEELMQPTSLHTFTGRSGLSIVIENGKKKKVTSNRVGFVFPYVAGYHSESANPWASFVGNNSGVFRFARDSEKLLQKLYQKFKCIPDGYFPFLFVDGHKFQHSYIPAEVMLLGGFMSQTAKIPKPEKVPASFPFENGSLSFHNNIIKAA